MRFFLGQVVKQNIYIYIFISVSIMSSIDGRVSRGGS